MALRGKPAPRDGGTLMRRYEDKFFDGCPLETTGRKRNLLNVARFLTYAVDECGGPMRFFLSTEQSQNQ